MICSLNEIASMIKKAAVGSGFPVGLADSLAGSAVWLCERDADGVGAALDVITAGFRPGTVRETGGSLLQVSGVDVGRYGPSLFELIVAGDCERVEIVDPDAPLLLLGLAGVVSDASGTAFELSTEAGLSIIVSSGSITVPATFQDRVGRITITSAVEVRRDRRPDLTRRSGIEVDDRLWAAATTLAARTYVPATEASRLRGAGAGLDDND